MLKLVLRFSRGTAAQIQPKQADNKTDINRVKAQTIGN